MYLFLLKRAFISLSVLLLERNEYPAVRASRTDAYSDIWVELASLSMHRNEMHLALVHKSQLCSQMCFCTLLRSFFLGVDRLSFAPRGALLNCEIQVRLGVVRY